MYAYIFGDSAYGYFLRLTTTEYLSSTFKIEMHKTKESAKKSAERHGATPCNY